MVEIQELINAWWVHTDDNHCSDQNLVRTISQAVSEIRYFLADIRTQYYDEEFGKGRWYQNALGTK